jgi:DNA invertase Pin-like site-specific DNA recombinase
MQTPTTIKRAAVYARVSKDCQETENQLLQMARFVESQGWERRDFIDHQSGKTAQRPQLQALFAAGCPPRGGRGSLLVPRPFYT